MHSSQTLPLSASALCLAAAVTVHANSPAGASISTFRLTDGFDVAAPPGGLLSSSGWDMASLEFVHDPATDTLTATVAMQQGKIAGNADGNGDPSAMAEQRPFHSSPAVPASSRS